MVPQQIQPFEIKVGRYWVHNLNIKGAVGWPVEPPWRRPSPGLSLFWLLLCPLVQKAEALSSQCSCAQEKIASWSCHGNDEMSSTSKFNEQAVSLEGNIQYDPLPVVNQRNRDDFQTWICSNNKRSMCTTYWMPCLWQATVWWFVILQGNRTVITNQTDYYFRRSHYWPQAVFPEFMLTNLLNITYLLGFSEIEL